MNCNTNFDKHETSWIIDACVRVSGGETTNGKEELRQLLFQKVPIRRVNKYLSALEIANEYAIYRNLCDQSIYSVVSIADIDKIMKAVISNRSRLALNRKKTRVVREAGRLLREYVGGRYNQTVFGGKEELIAIDTNESTKSPSPTSDYPEKGTRAVCQSDNETGNQKRLLGSCIKGRSIAKKIASGNSDDSDDVDRIVMSEGVSKELPCAYTDMPVYHNSLCKKPSVYDYNHEEHNSIFFNSSEDEKMKPIQKITNMSFKRKKNIDVGASFKEWLMKEHGLSRSTANTCLSGVKTVTLFACNYGYSDRAILSMVDFEEIQALWNTLLSDAYPVLSSYKYQMNWYLRFRISYGHNEDELGRTERFIP